MSGSEINAGFAEKFPELDHEFIESNTVSLSINPEQTRDYPDREALLASNRRIWEGVKDRLPESERERVKRVLGSEAQ